MSRAVVGVVVAIVIGVAATGVIALGAQAAAPHVVKYDTKLTISSDRGFLYHGEVLSDPRKCMRGRRVILFERRPGADRRLGTDRSEFELRDRRGHWGLIEAHGVRHRVYAKVTPKVRDRFVCRADRAPNTGTYG